MYCTVSPPESLTWNSDKIRLEDSPNFINASLFKNARWKKKEK